MTALAGNILARLPEAQALYHRLVLVVGSAGTGKTEALQTLAAEKGWPRVNVNLHLAERLLELTQKQRAIRTAIILDDLVRGCGSDVVLLDNLEILFAPQLAQDPLRLLQGISRNQSLVAVWPGSYDGAVLTYAEPCHPEAKRYSNPGALIVMADSTTAPAGRARQKEAA